MGVKDLWSVISPTCEKMSLWELRDKTIAIDLSAWICDSQFASRHQQNMYLRNLFFRTSYLIQIGVKPIFVCEGTAPALKAATMNKRLKKSHADQSKAVVRSRLNHFQKQCIELLSYLGIECTQAPGEAEAFCAHLNQLGIASGVVTQDSDAFLYGATEVYRNFQLAPHHSCDVYRIDVIEKKLGLTRSKMVAFSLLTGCDYTNGVQKVGKESALKFLKTLDDSEIFTRDHLEMCIREKALQDENFPPRDVIEEYLAEPNPQVMNFCWKQPDIPKFLSFTVRKLSWEEDYAEKKIIPLVTRWHLVHEGAACGFKAVSILKKRQLRGAQGYEVNWDPSSISTVEDKDLMEKVYPELVDNFEDSKRKRPKSKPANSKNKKTRQELKEENTLDKMWIADCAANQPTPLNFSYSEESELNLSSIVQTIVTRSNSNPAVVKVFSDLK